MLGGYCAQINFCARAFEEKKCNTNNNKYSRATAPPLFPGNFEIYRCNLTAAVRVVYNQEIRF